jgi:autotransporter-associated beta strand protein
LRKVGAGALTLSGSNTYGGLTELNAGTLVVAGGSALPAAGAVVLADNAGVTLRLAASQTVGSLAGGAGTGTVDLGTYTLTLGDATDVSLAAVVQGAGQLVKQGAGVLTLTGSNTFTGGLSVNGGTVALSGGAALADTVAVTLADAAGVTLRLDASETFGSLAGGGATGGSLQLASNVLTVGDGTNSVFGGVISGAGSLIKRGCFPGRDLL